MESSPNFTPKSSKAISSHARPGMRVLEFVKAGHRYTYRYETCAELALICSLLNAALDPRLNFDLEDARKVMESLGLAARSPAE